MDRESKEYAQLSFIHDDDDDDPTRIKKEAMCTLKYI